MVRKQCAALLAPLVEAQQKENARLVTAIDHLRGEMKDVGQRLTQVAEKMNHLEIVELPALSGRTHELGLKLNHLDVIEVRGLHKRTLELRQELERLEETTRSTIDYWEVRTDNIYANLGRMLGSSS